MSENEPRLRRLALEQYERAQTAENANATLRADVIELRQQVDRLREEIETAKEYVREQDFVYLNCRAENVRLEAELDRTGKGSER